tara:strand:- start:76464 stop:76757 length:294 start_codon:yes stop_codon:yes gene_type:complete
MAIFIIDTEVTQTKQYAVEAETSAEAVEYLEESLKTEEGVEEFSATVTHEYVTMSRPAMTEDEAVNLIRTTLGISEDDDIWDRPMIESMILWYDDED